MKYYIATSLENMGAHNYLRNVLDGLGHTITYDWTNHGPVWASGLEAIQEVAMLEMGGVVAADVVIVLCPGGRGTHAELGAAIASGKRIIFISSDDSHHDTSQKSCAFYHHPLVTKGRCVSEIEALIARVHAQII